MNALTRTRNNALRLIACGLVASSLGACASLEKGFSDIKSTVLGSDQNITEVASYNGPKARIAISDLDCKAAKCNRSIGTGMGDMLATSLFQSKKFLVLERGAGLEDVRTEIDLGGSGYSNKNKVVQKGGWEGADILIRGAITAFEPKASGRGGIGGVLSAGLGAITGGGAKKDNAYIAMDLRIVDVRTSRVVDAVKIEGTASSWKFGGFGGLGIGGKILAGGMSAYSNTPMEKAVADMLDKAIKEIASRTPDKYFRVAANY